MDLRRSRFNHALFLPSSSSSLPSSALSVPSSHRLRVDQYANNAVHCRKAINRTDVTSIEEGGEARWEGRTATAVSGSERFMSGSSKLSPCHFNATAAAVPCLSAFLPPIRSADQASALAHFGSETDVARHFDRMRCPYEGDAITRGGREAAMAIRPRTDDGLAPPPLSPSLRHPDQDCVCKCQTIPQ